MTAALIEDRARGRGSRLGRARSSGSVSDRRNGGVGLVPREPVRERLLRGAPAVPRFAQPSMRLNELASRLGGRGLGSATGLRAGRDRVRRRGDLLARLGARYSAGLVGGRRLTCGIRGPAWTHTSTSCPTIGRPYVDAWNDGVRDESIRLRTEVVPEPFVGTRDAPVVVLGRNPGWREGLPRDRDYDDVVRGNLGDDPARHVHPAS
jgi:hypothetical protein